MDTRTCALFLRFKLVNADMKDSAMEKPKNIPRSTQKIGARLINYNQEKKTTVLKYCSERLSFRLQQLLYMCEESLLPRMLHQRV
ncbi:hypothetical protein WAI453_012430 [Rhynchosporium graminicola]